MNSQAAKLSGVEAVSLSTSSVISFSEVYAMPDCINCVV